jgi:hypothetical protein
VTGILTQPARGSAARQLAEFTREYLPEVREKAEDALARLRARVPGATEPVYNTYNALVIGFCPGEKASGAVLSIALYPRWVNLFFLEGATLDDPQSLLKGSGSRVRSIRLDDPSVIDTPAVRALIGEAVKNADVPFDRRRARTLVIKSAAPRRRPRRPL